jgi:hypothetical protein
MLNVYVCVCAVNSVSRVMEEKSPLLEVQDYLCYCLGLFIIFGPPNNVIPRSTAEVASENGQLGSDPN